MRDVTLKPIASSRELLNQSLYTSTKNSIPELENGSKDKIP